MQYGRITRPIPPPPIVERAYELARSGEFVNVVEICQRLKSEGYSEISQHFDGAAIRADLVKICGEAQRQQR
jgi:hypothetical protein